MLSYGAHTFELFAYRTWCFSLFVFLSSRQEDLISITVLSIIVSAITLSGMISSILGANFCLHYKRNKVISLTGLVTVIIASITSLLLDSSIWIAILLLWIYNTVIMLDSGALTAGSVESSEIDNRGAVLAVHSMIGFCGGALGGPIIGFILDISGGETNLTAWQISIIAMSVGSIAVMLIQLNFWLRKSH
jgi:MFS family permease